MTALAPPPSQRPVPLPRSACRSLAVFDRHGAALHSVASVLARTSDRADRLVIATVTQRRSVWWSSLWRRDRDRDARAIVEDLYLSWVRDDLPRSSMVAGTDQTLRHDLHQLTDRQLGAVALCGPGGHNYRQAARVMGTTQVGVARDLQMALRALAA